MLFKTNHRPTPKQLSTKANLEHEIYGVFLEAGALPGQRSDGCNSLKLSLTRARKANWCLMLCSLLRQEAQTRGCPSPRMTGSDKAKEEGLIQKMGKIDLVWWRLV